MYTCWMPLATLKQPLVGDQNHWVHPGHCWEAELLWDFSQVTWLKIGCAVSSLEVVQTLSRNMESWGEDSENRTWPRVSMLYEGRRRIYYQHPLWACLQRVMDVSDCHSLVTPALKPPAPSNDSEPDSPPSLCLAFAFPYRFSFVCPYQSTKGSASLGSYISS